MSDVLRCPVCSCAHSFYPLHMRPRVQRASGIPCALFFERAKSFEQTSGATRRENEKLYPLSSSAGGRSSIPETFMNKSRSRGVLDHPPEPVIGRPFGRPVGG